MDSKGNLFVADSDHNYIHKISPNGETVPFAGDGTTKV
jgi:hypothetical protein